MAVVVNNRLLEVCVCLAVLAASVNAVARMPQEAIITLRPAEKFQTITGWEAVAQAAHEHSRAFPRYKDKLFDLAVNDLGINRLRLEIHSGSENPVDHFAELRRGSFAENDVSKQQFEVINDNNDPFVIDPKRFQFSSVDSAIENVVLPMRLLLEKRGERLFVNLNFVDFGDNRGKSDIRHNNNPEEYAEFMLAAFRHIKTKYNFVPDAIEVILEPDNHTGWTGTQIGNAIVATARRLKTNGFSPKFIVPSTTNAANAPIFIDDIAAVPGAMQHISEFSYHRYCCASEPILQRIADRAAKFGKQTSMLEWIGADHSTLHEDLKVAGNSAWEQYSLAGLTTWGPDNGGSYLVIDDTNAAKPSVTLGSRARFLRQYFRYVRAGARRIGAGTTYRSFDPLAFINSDGSFVVVVKTEASGTIQIKGLRPGTYGVSYATASETNSATPDVVAKSNVPLTTSIPSAGVITVFGKNPGPTGK